MTARNQALDGMRAVAVLMVVCFHFSIPELERGGPFGLELFFVLSGFLITGVIVGEIDRRGEVSLRRFLARRLLRLYPALLAFMLVLAPFAGYFSSARPFDDWLGGAALCVTYLLNVPLMIPRVVTTGGFAHLWTLSIEMQFYLLWGALLVACVRRGLDRRRLAVAALAGAAVLFALPWVLPTPLPGPSDGTAYYLRTDARFAELLLGCALALVLSTLPTRIGPTADRALGAASLLAVGVFVAMTRLAPDPFHVSRERMALTMPVAALAATVILARLATGERSVLARLARLGPLPAIGVLSYGIYLWHFPVQTVARDVAGSDRLVSIVVASAATLLMAVLSRVVVERPFLRRKDRLRDSPVAGLEAPGPGAPPGEVFATGPARGPF